METELQGCYILHVCAKELLAESERAISATVPHGHGLRHIFKLVHDWLCDGVREKRVLILDNVDDASFLLTGQSAGKRGQKHNGDSWDSQPLLTYLPRSQSGSILVTTRTRAAALELVEESDIVAVPLMDEPHALALLEKKLKTYRTSNGVRELAAALEYMPLAIVQAAAYIT
jgi:hypothetical protein